LIQNLTQQHGNNFTYKGFNILNKKSARHFVLRDSYINMCSVAPTTHYYVVRQCSIKF